jgi:hypothetical protein
VPQLRIRIKHYGWEEDIPQSQAFCRQLRRQWSRALCNNAAPALIQALPAMIQPAGMAACARGACKRLECRLPACRAVTAGFTGRWSGNNTVPARNFEQGNPLFQAVVRIDESLAATWVVWPEAKTGETAAAKAQREGQAMIALVQLGMGPAEDFTRLHRRMCQLRRPAPRIRSDRPDCP